MEIDLQATTIFERNYEAINSDKRFIINQGGSRSSKSYSVCQLAIVLALEEPNLVISILRKTFPALRASIMRDFFSVLNSFGIYNKKNHNKTEHTYTFPNGSIIEFFSVDDEQKVRGRKRDYAIVDEANQIWEEDFFQLNLRTTKKMIFLYNPSDRASWLYDLSPTESIFIKSTYHDNPFLEQSIINEIEGLKDKDEALYTIFALGERAITRENIFSKWEFLETKPERFKDFIYGIDYGFVHPTALVKTWYYEDEVFIEEMIYEEGMTSSDIVRRLKDLGITYKDKIIAEVARPEINAELQRENFTIINADKSVKGGINDVQRTKVYTNSKNLWKEYENYSWKKVGGQLTEEPVKLLDDLIDCFVSSTLITTQRGKVAIVDVIPYQDYALTSTGFKLITDKFSTGRKQINKYSLQFDTEVVYLDCTNNHKIKTTEGWKEISQLQSGMTVFLNNNSTARDINYTLVDDTLCNTSTICTKKCGNSIMEKEKMDTTSTTSTETVGITGLKTLKRLKLKNTLESTEKNILKIIQSGLKSFIKRVLRQQRTGISHQKDLSGTNNTQRTLNGVHQTYQKENVITVKQATNQNLTTQDSVHLNVKQPLEEKVGLMISNENVNVVEMNSPLVNIQKQKLVQVNVLETYEEEAFDITVADDHEFFANDILVHNCTRYTIRYITKYHRGNQKTYTFR